MVLDNQVVVVVEGDVVEEIGTAREEVDIEEEGVATGTMKGEEVVATGTTKREEEAIAEEVTGITIMTMKEVLAGLEIHNNLGEVVEDVAMLWVIEVILMMVILVRSHKEEAIEAEVAEVVGTHMEQARNTPGSIQISY